MPFATFLVALLAGMGVGSGGLYVVYLTLFTEKNQLAAQGLNLYFFIFATGAALLVVAYGLFFRSRGKRLQQAALLLVLGGGIGNLIDRVLNGEVVDYINLLFMRFAVFNFADICVCVGVALWVLVIFLDEVHADDAASKEQ